MPTEDLSASTSLREIADVNRVHVRTLYRLSKEPGFPRPILLGARTIRYRTSEVNAYFASRAVDLASEPTQLATPAARAKRAATLAAKRKVTPSAPVPFGGLDQVVPQSARPTPKAATKRAAAGPADRVEG